MRGLDLDPDRTRRHSPSAIGALGASEAEAIQTLGLRVKRMLRALMR